MGGSFADVYTDAVQAIIMAITRVIVFISGIVIFGNGSIRKGIYKHYGELSSQDLNLVMGPSCV